MTKRKKKGHKPRAGTPKAEPPKAQPPAPRPPILPRILARARGPVVTHWGAATSVLVALAFFVLVSSIADYRDVFAFDNDEGNNVIKALLLHHGYSFFDEIWSDQPPLFSYLLKWVLSAFGWDMAVARRMILFFSAIVVFVVHDIVRREVDQLSAAVAVLVLTTSCYYIKLSVAVMLGLPSIAWALLSLWCLLAWSRHRRYFILAIAGALLGLSVATKMFTLFLAPVFVAFVGITAVSGSWRRAALWERAKPIGVWGAAFCLALLAGLWPVLVAEDASALVRPHAAAQSGWDGLTDFSGPHRLAIFLREDRVQNTLAIMYVGFMLRRGSAGAVLCTAWLFGAVLVLYFHEPVWYHHRLLINIPAAVLAGSAFGVLTRRRRGATDPGPGPGPGPGPTVRSRGALVRSLVAALLLLGFLLVTNPSRFTAFHTPEAKRRGPEYMELLDWMRVEAPGTKTVVTSMPMYAFLLGRPTPPSIAITSAKRFDSGSLDTKDILAAIDEYEPEQILLNKRWTKDVRRTVKEHIRERYSRTEHDSDNMDSELYVINSLLQRGAARDDSRR